MDKQESNSNGDRKHPNHAAKNHCNGWDCGNKDNTSEATTADSPEGAVSNLANVADHLEQENKLLRMELLSLRKERHVIRELTNKAKNVELSLEHAINASLLEQEEALSDCQSALSSCRSKQAQLREMEQWTSLNDCFFISTQGAFATINGLRLGAEAVLENLDMTSSSCSLCEGTSAKNTTAATATFPSYRGGPSSTGSINETTRKASVKVPWPEINSALGQFALLLVMLQENCSDISFRHEIICLGSNSKIGVKRSATSTAYYNLFSDDSFQFFGRRNFNTALQSLLQCVADAAETIQRRDPTIALPHLITRTAGGTDLLVGGLSVSYGNDAMEWTRAMKYLLTNVKHLLLFRPFILWDITAAAASLRKTADEEEEQDNNKNESSTANSTA